MGSIEGPIHLQLISTPTVNSITMVAIARSFGAARVASRGFANAARAPQQNTLVAARSAFRNNAARNVIQKRGIVAESTAAAMVAAAKIQGVARNPSLRGQLFQYAVLGFAFAEATGLFAL